MAALSSQKETGEPIQPLPSADGAQQGAITRFIVCGNLFEARATQQAHASQAPKGWRSKGARAAALLC